MFLDGDAWRAVLPAWMVASLRSGDRVHRLLGSVLATLDPGFTPKAPEVFSERAAGLTAAQRTAVAEFVSWAAQQPVLADDAHSEAEVGRLQSACTLRTLFRVSVRRRRLARVHLMTIDHVRFCADKYLKNSCGFRTAAARTTRPRSSMRQRRRPSRCSSGMPAPPTATDWSGSCCSELGPEVKAQRR